MKGGHELGDADEQHYRGEHLGHDHIAQEDLFSFEGHARQGIGGGDAAEHGQSGGSARHEQGVQQEARHTPVDDIRKVGPDPLGREHVQEVHVQTFRVGAEGGDEHHIIGVKGDHADDDHEEVETELQQAALDLSFAQGKCRQQGDEQRGDHQPDQRGVFDLQPAEDISDACTHLSAEEEAVQFREKGIFPFGQQVRVVKG